MQQIAPLLRISPQTTVEKCKSGGLQINCNDTKQHIPGITKRLPFENIDFYDFFRIPSGI